MKKKRTHLLTIILLGPLAGCTWWRPTLTPASSFRIPPAAHAEGDAPLVIAIYYKRLPLSIVPAIYHVQTLKAGRDGVYRAPQRWEWLPELFPVIQSKQLKPTYYFVREDGNAGSSEHALGVGRPATVIRESSADERLAFIASDLLQESHALPVEEARTIARFVEAHPAIFSAKTRWLWWKLSCPEIPMTYGELE